MAEDKQDSLPAGHVTDSVPHRTDERTYGEGTDSGAEGFLSGPLNANHYPRKHNKMECIIFNITKFHHLSEYDLAFDNSADVEELARTLRALGFVCTTYKDTDAEGMYTILETLANDTQLLSGRDGFLCWIITHGNGRTLDASDQALLFDSLLKPFTGDRCPGLFGKPKLFFVQAMNKSCKSICVADSKAVGADEHSVSTQCRIPAMADFYLASSCAPGFYESGDEENLSHFVKMVSKVVREKVPQDPKQVDLSTLMAYVVEGVQKDFLTAKGKSNALCYQVPCAISTLTRHVAFSRLVS